MNSELIYEINDRRINCEIAILPLLRILKQLKAFLYTYIISIKTIQYVKFYKFYAYVILSSMTLMSNLFLWIFIAA